MKRRYLGLGDFSGFKLNQGFPSSQNIIWTFWLCKLMLKHVWFGFLSVTSFQGYL